MGERARRRGCAIIGGERGAQYERRLSGRDERTRPGAQVRRAPGGAVARRLRGRGGSRRAPRGRPHARRGAVPARLRGPARPQRRLPLLQRRQTRRYARRCLGAGARPARRSHRPRRRGGCRPPARRGPRAPPDLGRRAPGESECSAAFDHAVGARRSLSQLPGLPHERAPRVRRGLRARHPRPGADHAARPAVVLHGGGQRSGRGGDGALRARHNRRGPARRHLDDRDGDHGAHGPRGGEGPPSRRADDAHRTPARGHGAAHPLPLQGRLLLRHRHPAAALGAAQGRAGSARLGRVGAFRQRPVALPLRRGLRGPARRGALEALEGGVVRYLLGAPRAGDAPEHRRRRDGDGASRRARLLPKRRDRAGLRGGVPGAPFLFDGRDRPSARPGPALGEHNDEVLARRVPTGARAPAARALSQSSPQGERPGGGRWRAYASSSSVGCWRGRWWGRCSPTWAPR